MFFIHYRTVLIVATFTSVITENKLLRIHKTVEIKVFLNFLACWWKNPDPGGPKKLADPMDLEHWLYVNRSS